MSSSLGRVVLFVVAIFGLIIANAAQADPISLAALLGDGSLTIGDKLFDHFSYLPTGDMPGADQVNVDTYTDGSGNLGLIFQGAFTDLPGDGGSDALIGFLVTVLDPTMVIVGANLNGNPNVIGGPGIMSVTETFFPTDPSAILNIYDIVPGATKLTDSVAFSPGYKTLWVQKDILAASAGLRDSGIPTLSFITQTFPQAPVPEPTSLMLMGLGLVGVAVIGRRRTRRA